MKMNILSLLFGDERHHSTIRRIDFTPLSKERPTTEVHAPFIPCIADDLNGHDYFNRPEKPDPSISIGEACRESSVKAVFTHISLHTIFSLSAFVSPPTTKTS